MIDQYAELRAALDAGPTPGPWSAYISGNTMQVDSTPQASGGRPCVVFWPGFDGNDLSVRANAKNTRYIAAANPEAIRALLAERDAQAAEIARLRMAAQAADDALTIYERYGEICPFEGEPMIHASTLVELGELARAALTQQEQV
ncbi:hypothetical protein [Eoetvoesiella caeni]|uniref:Ead/Ea22-like protein n=1 Tax=Eoetvoesiella caeni TaxID=645616 RepID=A0A366HAH6_9BURK|nr:hypothetical protein [Eoetvoesiella caeni]MCI2809341.1 ead/Ea22-like family protein [Eoetvoesiella caeni]NYT54482.1 hypothetical protein [Eoetvoesiella caeni]RBP39330.1 hypothetical protein DFR37_105123 [Eoetvoesiella caeni]